MNHLQQKKGVKFLTKDCESNRRRFERLAKSMPVRFRIIDEAKEDVLTSKDYVAIARDISEGGIFIELPGLEEKFLSLLCSSYPKMNLSINLSEQAEAFEAVAEVAWRRREETPLQRRLGLGMKFVGVSTEERGRLSTYIGAQLEEQDPIEASFPTRIESSIIVKQPKEAVYNLLKNMEQFPQFIRDVKCISILNGKRNRIITEWEIDIEGTTFKWKEEDIFDDKNMSIKFKMIKGDFGRYEGEWSLFELLTGTELRLSVIINWGMPKWERHTKHILENKIKIHLQKMLAAIKDRMWSKNITKLVKFACIIHTIDLGYVSSNFDPSAREKRNTFLKKILEWTPSFQCSYITGIQSLTGKKIDGELILCPLLPEQILNMNGNSVLERVVEAGKVAERKGAKIVGLGAYTAGVGRRGILVANALNIPVTTGTSYTIAVTIESVLKVAEKIGIELSDANVMIVGATGGIGSICTKILANSVKKLILIARNKKRLHNLARSIRSSSIAKIKIKNEINKFLLQHADIIITVTSTPQDLIDVRFLKPGALVCDISIPKNISKEAADSRRDILVIDGGIVEVPGNVNFNFDIGLSPGLTYACIAETMILALEERYECYSIGGNISLDKVREISQLALKHGFKLAKPRSFGKEVIEENLEIIRRKI